MGPEWVLGLGSGDCGDCIGLALYYMHSIASLIRRIQTVCIGMGQSRADLVVNSHPQWASLLFLQHQKDRGRLLEWSSKQMMGCLLRYVGILHSVLGTFRHSVRPMGAELVLRMDRYISPKPTRTSDPLS